MKNKLKLIQLITVTIFSLASPLIFAETTGDLQTVLKGNSAFGLELFQRLRENEGNLFFSPYSISTALAMTLPVLEAKQKKKWRKSCISP